MKKVWIFGDSTSAENINNPETYQQEWAFFLKDYLNDQIEYKNVAHGGTTLKTYYYCEAFRRGQIHKNIFEDSRWYKILCEIKEGDFFVFFVGGINDHGQICEDNYYPCPDGDYIVDDYFQVFENRDVYMYVGSGYGTHRYHTLRSTVPEYEKLLELMITQVMEKGAIPLLVRGTGKYYMHTHDNFDVFPSSHQYMEILPNVAQRVDIGYLDVGGVFDEGFKTKGYKYMMENIMPVLS